MVNKFIIYFIVAIALVFAFLMAANAQQVLVPGEGTVIILRPQQPTQTCFAQPDGGVICITASN